MTLRRYGILVFSPCFMHLCKWEAEGDGGEGKGKREGEKEGQSKRRRRWEARRDRAGRDNERAADDAGLIISRNT